MDSEIDWVGLGAGIVFLAVFGFIFVRETHRRSREMDAFLARRREIERRQEADRQAGLAMLREMRAAEREENAERLRQGEARRTAQIRQLKLLRIMTPEELDIVWRSRPLISWNGPMQSMSLEGQRLYWLQNLHLTFWEIPRDVLSAAAARLDDPPFPIL